MKKNILIIAISVFILGLSGLVPRSVANARLLIKDADNQVCPVTGEKIERKRFNTTYQGKRYWFNSYDSVRKFKESPAQYMDKRSEPAAEEEEEDRGRTGGFWGGR